MLLIIVINNMWSFYIILFICTFISSSSSSPVKYCVNCKYFVPSPFFKDTFGKCSAFRKTTDSNKIDYLISGKEKIEYKYCSTARENENLCGEEGKMYFERSNFIKDFILPFIKSVQDKNNINI